MPGPLGAAEAVAQAFKEIAGLLRDFLSSKEARRFKYRTEAAMEYVFVNEKAGQYEDLSDQKQKQLFRHFRKRIFDES